MRKHDGGGRVWKLETFVKKAIRGGEVDESGSEERGFVVLCVVGKWRVWRSERREMKNNELTVVCFVF